MALPADSNDTRRTFQTKLIESGYNTFERICQSLEVNGDEPGWPDNFGTAIRRSLKEDVGKYRVLSLFSGAGGLDIGFRDAGFTIVESVELEKKFCETLERNSGAQGKYFDTSRVNCIDIREFDTSHLNKIDFVIGGPPCQTFSAAGRRANGVMGTDDSRGVLFREYERILNELKPRGFLFENVYGIVGAQDGRPWKEIQVAFSDAGYTIFSRILDAADYGVPQHRERLIIVGLRNGEYMFPRPTHGPDSLDQRPFYTASEAISGLPATHGCGRVSGRYEGLLEGIPPGLNYSFYTEEMGHPNPVFAWRSKFSDFLYKADPDKPVRTIKAQGGQWTGPLHWENRHFSIAEYKRLQTFPDNYEIAGNESEVIHQIGNSVPPQMARMLAISIAQQVFGVELPFRLSLMRASESLHFRQRKRDLSKEYEQKAREAIALLEPAPQICAKHPSTESRVVRITPQFEIVDEDCESMTPESFRVTADWSRTLKIAVSDGRHPPRYSVKITPTKPWILPVDKIELELESTDYQAITLAWKFLEEQLRLNGYKADLVQLNGYYQYTPALKITMSEETGVNIPEPLRSVTIGKCTRRMIAGEDLAKLWAIDDSEVMETAEWLKTLGYEVRNSNTNPQIPEDMWLIPYQFPTLTKKSVQLRKKLR